jgi:hypothetical protein
MKILRILEKLVKTNLTNSQCCSDKFTTWWQSFCWIRSLFWEWLSGFLVKKFTSLDRIFFFFEYSSVIKYSKIRTNSFLDITVYIHLRSMFCFAKGSLICCQMSLYMNWFMLPSTRCNGPTTSRDHPQTLISPSPYFTVGKNCRISILSPSERRSYHIPLEPNKLYLDSSLQSTRDNCLVVKLSLASP